MRILSRAAATVAPGPRAPDVGGPGPQRIILGREGEAFYTPDHYGTFIPLNGRKR